MTVLTRWSGAATLALTVTTLAAAAHPTPKVVLIKHADFIRQSTAGAQQYFVRTVSIGKNDLATIRRDADFLPDDPDVQFYLGEGGGGPAGPPADRLLSPRGSAAAPRSRPGWLR